MILSLLGIPNQFFAIFVGIICLFVILLSDSHANKKIVKYTILISISVVVLAIAEYVEQYLAGLSDFTKSTILLRTILSIACYTIRPLLAYFCLGMVTNYKENKYLFGLIVICFILYSTSLFGKFVFYIDENNVYLVDTLNDATKLFGTLLKRGDVVLIENDLPDNYS